MMKVIMIPTIISVACVFGVSDRLANSPLEITSKMRGRPLKVDNMLHGLSDEPTRFLNVKNEGA
jgi:hypothetical protein